MQESNASSCAQPNMAIHPNNCLWLVDQNGVIIYYNLESKQFKTLVSSDHSQIASPEILFKCVASCKRSLFAITCDHRLFVHVFSATNKIVKDFEFWENQRWNFLTGFSHTLLPTDRPVYSNYQGTKFTPIESFKLPSDNWQWQDTDWLIEEWQYAADFSLDKQFTKEKNILSMVRKRRYHRKAYYAKLDEWVEMESISYDKYLDPILDVAVGGQDATRQVNTVHKDDPGQRERESLAVWIVTISGRIYFRENVDALRPEGTAWIEVSISEVLNPTNVSSDECDDDDRQDEKTEPKIEEIIKLSVGSSGICWALTSSGRCLVRIGVSCDNLMGTCWQLIEPPFNTELSQISVGQDSIYAIDKQMNLWFRKGVRSAHSSANLMCAIGSGWMNLSNQMSAISVNAFDQCFAISTDRTKLYFRMGVEPGMLCGNLWKLIAKIQDTSDHTTHRGDHLDSESGSLNDLTIKSDVSSNSNDFISNSSSVAYLANQTTNSWRSISASACLVINDTFFKTNNYLFAKKHPCNMLIAESISEDLADSIESASIETDDVGWKNAIIKQLVERYEIEISPFKGQYSKAVENGTWMKSASILYMSNESKIKNFTTLDLNSGQNFSSNIFNHVNSYLYSTNVGGTYKKTDFIRAHLELDRDGSSTLSNTESATLTFRFASGKDKRGKASYKTNVINLAEVVAITSSCNIINFPFPNVMFVHLTKEQFIFAFDDEKELTDWFGVMNVVCNNLNNLSETVFSPFHKPTVFLISLFGQPYAGYLLSDHSILIKRNKLKEKLDKNHQAQRNLKYKLHKLQEDRTIKKSSINEDGETEQSIECILNELRDEESESNKLLENLLIASGHCVDQKSSDHFYCMHLGGGNFKQIQFTCTGVVWGLSENGSALVHNNFIGGSIYNNLLSTNDLNFITDTRTYAVYENERWMPIKGFSSQLLPTDRPAWSDESGLVELNKDEIKLPSSEWKWFQREWTYVCDSNTDCDGWQYSIDFSSLPFHSQKKISDLVRRRKWLRVAKLETSAPWRQLPDESPICLQSIAMYETNSNDEEDRKSQVILWAITIDGQAVVREGVCKTNPVGEKWEYVVCRENLKSVTISGQLMKDNHANGEEHFIQVWAVGEDGLGYLRHDVTPTNPLGTLWFTIESPGNNPINRLMSCPSNCFMLDSKGFFYFRDKIKQTFPEGLSWCKLKDGRYKILNASFPASNSDAQKVWVIVEIVDKQNRNIVLCIAQNHNNQYNLTENYEFKFKPFIKNAFSFVSC